VPKDFIFVSRCLDAATASLTLVLCLYALTVGHLRVPAVLLATSSALFLMCRLEELIGLYDYGFTLPQFMKVACGLVVYGMTSFMTASSILRTIAVCWLLVVVTRLKRRKVQS
jgi:hypothetical protein